MHARDKLRSREVAIVILQQEFPSFFIERGFRIRVDEKTFHGHQNVPDTVARLPILL